MRKSFPNSVMKIMDKDDRVVVLLGDIGVHSFREVFAKYPKRIYNMGICEQSMVSVAAGLSMAGFIPIIHSISPFLVERAFEQIKDDFGYQVLRGTFVGIDVSQGTEKLGYTHHCAGDQEMMMLIPGMDVHVPTNSLEFEMLLCENYDKGLNYFRIT